MSLKHKLSLSTKLHSTDSNLLEDAVASEDCAEDDERNDYAEDHLDAVEWFQFLWLFAEGDYDADAADGEEENPDGAYGDWETEQLFLRGGLGKAFGFHVVVGLVNKAGCLKDDAHDCRLRKGQKPLKYEGRLGLTEDHEAINEGHHDYKRNGNPD